MAIDIGNPFVLFSHFYVKCILVSVLFTASSAILVSVLFIASSSILVSVLFIGPSSLLPLDLKKKFITSFCAFF